MGLETYRQKRDFSRTAEPKGRRARGKSGNRFVVQKHAARRLHYDFRLEHDGVLASWAIPKGPSLDPKVKRLAMQVEDHPLEYGDFEGIIPKGEYGGGTVLLWDQGSWVPEGDAAEMLKRGRLTFELNGEKLKGRFHLVRAAPSGKKDERRWLLLKSDDAAARPGSDAEIVEQRPESVLSGRDLDAIAADPAHQWTSKKTDGAKKRGRSAAAAGAEIAETLKKQGRVKGVRRAGLPDFLEPQLTTLVPQAPEGDDWLHEIKLDGYRILARLEGGRAQLWSRRGNDWTRRLPTVASALGSLPVESAWLDGEVVVLNERGLSDFQALQNSLEAGRDLNSVYFIFDAPFLNGFDLQKLPLRERKALLKVALRDFDAAHVRYGDHIEGGGPAFFARACELGLEGIVCKRAEAPYTAGRGRDWLKVKCLLRQEFVIGGYTDPGGARSHFGALLLGVRENGGLSYAGKVGTGFTQASLAELSRRLRRLEQKQPAFENPPRGADSKGVHWVKPELVAEVAFVERTRDGLIRHASFQGLRDDKAPDDVHAEEATRGAKASKQPRTTRSKRLTKVKAATGSSKRREVATEPAEPPLLNIDLSRFEVTHPDRVLYPDQGLTKRDLMLYYAQVARWMLPHVASRPLMLVRCPEGAAKQCFHQKHPSQGMPKAVGQVEVPAKKGAEQHVMIEDAAGLFGLIQMGALEIHSWQSRAAHVERPDQLVFDLDPDEALPWARVIDAAVELRARLKKEGLTGFLRTTGGKGLHIVVPVQPSADFEQAKRFTKRIADSMVLAAPNKYVATMTKSRRSGKIFIDYFRNGQGATAICSFSTRARSGAPVAVPISWDELTAELVPAELNVKTVPARLAAQKKDPWRDFERARAELPPK